jgi:Protein of unknown function (DUF3987)
MSTRPSDYALWPRERQNAFYDTLLDKRNQFAATAGEATPFVSTVSDPSGHLSWPEPKPLPTGLASVAAFDLDFLPASIAPWVADIAERMQCPTDFVAIPSLVGLGSVLGRKIGIRPKQRTDWLEVPNLWACIVGRPGTMKSPAMGEALKPLSRLDACARDAHTEELRNYTRAIELHKLKLEEARAVARKALRDGTPAPPFDIEGPDGPKARRYIVNDTTYEALGEILADNPNGTMAFRDELVSLLKMDRGEYVAARGFYLTAWNGTAGYTFDRILRGKTRIEAACLSLLGSTQPGRLAEYVRRATEGGSGDDGLIQRFGLLVWPDQDPEWRETDRYPNSDARTNAWGTFERLDKLDPDIVGAERDMFETLPFLRFDDRAQGEFSEWQFDLERRLRSGDMSPPLESHLAKYRKLVPAIALINHLADGGTGSISVAALARAVALSRVFGNPCQARLWRRSHERGRDSQSHLAPHPQGRTSRRFRSARHSRREWSGLTDTDQIRIGLELLADYDWLGPKTLDTGAARAPCTRSTRRLFDEHLFRASEGRARREYVQERN